MMASPGLIYRESDRHWCAGPGGQLRRPGDGRPRVGRQNRQAGLDLPHDPASRRARSRHVAEGLLDDRGHARELGLRLGRHRARPDLPADRPAGRPVLRRPSAADRTSIPRQSSRSTPTPAKCAGTFSSRITTSGTTTTPRRLRSSTSSERPADSGRRHRREVGPDVFSRARDGQADLSGRGAARAAERHPRRSDVADAAVSREAAAAVAARASRPTRSSPASRRTRSSAAIWWRRSAAFTTSVRTRRTAARNSASCFPGSRAVRISAASRSIRRWATSSSTRATSAAWAAWTRRPTAITVAYRRFSPLGRGTVNARFWNPAEQPAVPAPPWAHLMAINANTGDIVWRVPLGTSDELEAKGIKNTGAFGQGGPIVTAGGLVFIAGTIDKRFRAFDSRTGQVLWEGRLESEGHTTPMTYMAPERQAVRRRRDDRGQCVCVGISGVTRRREKTLHHRGTEETEAAPPRTSIARGRTPRAPAQ